MCNQLDIKLVITLSKYIFRAFEFIEAKDQSIHSIMLTCIGATNIINPSILLRAQQKIQEKYGQCAILKVAFEKNPVC